MDNDSEQRAREIVLDFTAYHSRQSSVPLNVLALNFLEHDILAFAQEKEEAGIRSVLRIRCMEHRNIPQYNTNEASGAECPACEIVPLRAGIEKFNAQQAKVPHLTTPPKTVQDGLLFLAVWFDALYDDAKTGKDDVQRDLRKWAEEFVALQSQLAAKDTENQRLRLGQLDRARLPLTQREMVDQIVAKDAALCGVKGALEYMADEKNWDQEDGQYRFVRPGGMKLEGIFLVSRHENPWLFAQQALSTTPSCQHKERAEQVTEAERQEQARLINERDALKSRLEWINALLTAAQIVSTSWLEGKLTKTEIGALGRAIVAALQAEGDSYGPAVAGRR